VNEAGDKEAGGIQHSTAIFTMVLRFRQACCHAGLAEPVLKRLTPTFEMTALKALTSAT
jgi:hypothetical protein